MRQSRDLYKNKTISLTPLKSHTCRMLDTLHKRQYTKGSRTKKESMSRKWKYLKGEPDFYSSDKRVINEEGKIVCDVWTNKKDCRLIAAAPDLLEALEQIAALGADKQTGGYELLDNAIKLAKEAIAKTKEIQK